MDHLIGNQNCLEDILDEFSKAKEAMPVSFYNKHGKLLTAFTNHKFYFCVLSPVFIIKNIDRKTGCMVLSPLIPIDIEGCPVELCNDLYSLDLYALIETNFCITVDLDCICGIARLPSKLINRYIPKIEPKC